MVYFIKDTMTLAIKIGWSKTPKKRLATLQTANPHLLVLLGAIPGTEEVETQLHKRFSEHALQGEWFRGEIIEAVLEIIAAHIRGDDMSDNQEKPSGNDGLQGISQIPGLKMKGLTMQLSERKGDPKNGEPSGTVYCRLDLKYLLEFESNVVDKELADLRQAITGTGSLHTIKLRHVFFDEDNAVIPFFYGTNEQNNQHIVGGAQAITGVQGEVFRVLVVFEKQLGTGPHLHPGWGGVDVFLGNNYVGEHPLKKARKLVAHIRG